MDSLQNIRRFILEERELFGDLLIAERRPGAAPGISEDDMAKRKKAAKPHDEEGVLFVPEEKEHPKEAWESARSLGELESMIHGCKKCDLWQYRTNFVFGTGNPHATFMVVGEAPGADEDLKGEPFVGRAGQLLNKILEAIGFKREDVYIANVVKSRPPNNRKPTPEEIEACLPYLEKQVALIKPKVILCLGLTAAQSLLKTNETMGHLRGGHVYEYQGIPVLVTYHPAALLRNPGWKRATWEDVQAARKVHDERVKP